MQSSELGLPRAEFLRQRTRLAIMQPYFVPYLGYFQLIQAVDRFIILDDVNYIKGGWINRNRVLINGEPRWITIPLEKPSPNRFIRDTQITADERWRSGLLNQCANAYRKAPYLRQGLSVLEGLLQARETNLSKFLTSTIVRMCHTLGIATEIVPTSSVYPKAQLAGSQRIVQLCRSENASVYVNPPGGQDLYDASDFAKHGIKLQFVQPVLTPYEQGVSSFTPGMSIIDVLMWNSLDWVREQVRLVSLVDAAR